MSIYTNPVYGNPTTIPYTKLKDDEQLQLHDLITINPTDKQLKLRRQHRIASAVSCILCTLAIILTFMAAILAIYGVFGRCFRAEDLDSDNFEKFLKMTQGNGQIIPPQGAYSRRVLPFPRQPHFMPGPVIPSSENKLGHAQCPVMNLIQCNRESFDGYSLTEHQKRVDLSLGKAMLNGNLNTSYAVNNARFAFKQCVKEYDGDKQSMARNFVKEIMKINSFGSTDKDIATTLANITAHNRLNFGVDTLFQVEVGANYLAPDGDHPYIMYLDQKLPPTPNVAQMALMRRFFQLQFSENDYQQLYLNIPRIQKMAADPDDSNAWKSFTAAEAYARWPFFNFTTYLSKLNHKQQFVHNVKEFMFIVKTPHYFDQLNALFVPKTKVEEKAKLDLFKKLSIYNLFSNYDKYFGIEEVEDQIRKTYQLKKASTSSHSKFHFRYNYKDGSASYEALRFCAQELREHLPHIASAVHSDMTLDFPLQEEIQEFEELIEMVRNELIEFVNKSEIDEKLKEVLIEKLRKIGILFTTRESLEKESFEEVHRKLDLEKSKKYIDSIKQTKNFLFYRKLERLNSTVEALRSSAFSEASAASIDIEYSRLGNYLNVPSSILTSPILATGMDSPRTMVFSNLAWILAREMTKSIDSEGVLYNALGVHKRGENGLNQLKQLWTNSQSCLQQNIHGAHSDATTNAIVVRKSINEIIGFQIAYETFAKALDRALGAQKSTKSHRTKATMRTDAQKDFFQTTTSVYCDTKQRGASIALLDKFVDTYIKSHEILDCSKKYINFECNVQPAKQ